MTLRKQLFAVKGVDVLMAEMAGEHGLRRVLGPVSLTALGVGAIIGAGIFVLTGLAANVYAGPALALSFVVAGLGCTFHALRHTHITHLLRSLVPVHVVSARAGHARPITTLNVYSHLLEGDQEKAAAIMDELLRADIKDR